MAPMNDPDPPPKPIKDKAPAPEPRPDTAKAKREAALGEALRANLRRRKGAPDAKKSG